MEARVDLQGPVALSRPTARGIQKCFYERERLVTEDTVTQLLEDSATVFGQGSPRSARASLWTSSRA
jgi:hypothetical protein